MFTFGSNREVCMVRRERTNTPLQALVTLNDPVYIEAAQALGRRMVAFEGGIAEKAAYGFQLSLIANRLGRRRGRAIVWQVEIAICE